MLNTYLSHQQIMLRVVYNLASVTVFFFLIHTFCFLSYIHSLQKKQSEKQLFGVALSLEFLYINLPMQKIYKCPSAWT